MARYLLKNGISLQSQCLCDYDPTDPDCASPFEYFAQKGNWVTWGLEVFQLLLDRAANPDHQSLEYVLGAAIEGDCLGAVRLLVDTGVNIDDVCIKVNSCWFGTVLGAAVYKGNIEMVRLLLDKGADVNAQEWRYGNALQIAASGATTRSNYMEVIQLLLDKGANINAQGGKYGNALQAAADKSDIKVVQVLLDNGANVNAQGGEYGNALLAAVYNGNIEVVLLLLEKGANANAPGAEYGSALQAAAVREDMEVRYFGNPWQAAAVNDDDIRVIQLLLDNGANINNQGGQYGNALQAAVYRGKIGVIRLLLNKGANVNAQGGMFGTALQAAAYNGNIKVIQLLLDNGADINARAGKYGAALKELLAETSVDAGLKVPGDAYLLFTLLEDHAPILLEDIQRRSSDFDSDYFEDIEMRFLNEDRCSLNVFRELLKSRGWKSGA